MNKVRFGTVAVVGKDAKRVVKSAEDLAKTALGQKIAEDGQEAGYEVKEAIERSGMRRNSKNGQK